jgi:hypothetical protein
MNTAYALPISQLDPISQNIFTGGQALAPYLGPLPQLSNVDSYESTNRQFFTFPESKKGMSQHLGETVIDVLFTVDNTFISRDILPLLPTDQVTFNWTQFILNAHMLELNPYTTRAHAVTQKRNIRKANLVRRGIEAEFEADFLKTDMGRASFLGALRQISNALKNTIHYDGIRAIVNCHRQQNQFLKKATVSPEKEFERFLDNDIFRFALVQKEKNGLVKLHAEINSAMQAAGGEADAYLMPEGIAINQALVRSENTDYYMAGQMGPDRINGLARYSGPAGANTQGTLARVEPTHMLVDSTVYIVKEMNIQGLNPSDTQALSQVRQVGEYFKMIDDCQDYSTYTSKERSILIYDEDADDMVEITLQNVIEHAGIWDDQDFVKHVSGSNNPADADSDFMVTFESPSGGTKHRRPISTIGDIDPAYLTAQHIVNAGKAIMAALQKVSSTTTFVNFFEPDSTQANTYKITQNYTGKNWSTHLTNLLGIKVENEKKITDTAATVYGLAPVITLSTAPKGDVNDTASINSKLESLFYKTLVAGAPATKRAEVNAIVSDESMSRIQKSALIKEKIVQYVQDKVAGCIFKSDKDVHDWHKEKCDEYEALVAKENASQQKSSVMTDKKVVGYVPVGTDLTGTGLEYLDSVSTSVSGTGYQGLGMMYESRQLKAGSKILDEHYKNLNQTAESPFVRTLGALWLSVPFNKKTLLNLANNDIPVPFNVLLFRPHMQYMTQGIVKCKKGGTGVTPIGTTDMRLNHTTGTKMANMHFTTHTRSIVTQSQNVHVVPDVFSQEYLGGGGSRFWTPKEYRAKVFTHLQNSLICVFVPLVERKFPKRMDVSGRFYTEYALQTNKDDRLHYSTAYRYNQLYNFRGDGAQGSETPMMTLQRIHNNRIVVEGHHQLWNKKLSEHSRIVVGKGHWGQDVYAGCGQVRNGKLTQLREQNYSTKSSN